MNDAKSEQHLQWLRLLKPFFNTQGKSRGKKCWRRLMIMAVPAAAIMLNTAAFAAPTTDYTVTELTATTKMTVGGVIRATDTTCLTQNDPNRPVIVNSLHWSVDSNVTLDDTRIATHRVDTQPYSCSPEEFWTKPNLSVGTYYLKSFADYRNSAVEIDETNNGSPVTIIEVVADGQADITVELLDYPTEVTPGQTISVSRKICNKDIKSTGGFRTGLYFSTDSTINAQDTLLGSTQNFLYNEHCSNPNVKSHGELPRDLLIGGTYFIGLFGDYSNTVVESDEGNNSTVGVPITVVSATNDLVISSLEGPVVGVRGLPLSIKAEVCNLISDKVPGQFGSLYLKDSDATTNNISIGFFYNSLSSTPCTSNIFSFTFIPKTMAPGTYDLGATLDIMNMVQEVDKSNNTITGNAIVIQ